MNRNYMKHTCDHHHHHQGKMKEVPQSEQTLINIKFCDFSNLPEIMPGLQTRIPQITAINSRVPSILAGFLFQAVLERATQTTVSPTGSKTHKKENAHTEKETLGMT
jgi:hypothetical protein